MGLVSRDFSGKKGPRAQGWATSQGSTSAAPTHPVSVLKEETAVLWKWWLLLFA